jgi:hypothetical protein
MGIWQIVWIALMALSFGIAIAKHGQLRDGKYNAWITLISLVIETAILYLGGFFG